MQKLAVFLALFLFWCNLQGQYETSKWIFGSKAGFDFMTTPLSQISNSMNTVNGATSPADAAGNLLFYSSGDTVWNRLHQPMANGTGLFGHKWAWQHIAVPRPGSTTVYYLFTTDIHSQLVQKNGLCYSVIDMALAGGNGSVTVKNVQLMADALWQVAATKHCNGQDIWIVSHEANTDVFRSYLLTATGLSSAVVQSTTGPVTYTSSFAGQTFGADLKISPTGQRLAMGITDQNLPEWFALFDFDNVNGGVSNYRKLPVHPQMQGNSYGCEFSPGGSKLYGISDKYLYQWNLCGTDSATLASKDSLVLGTHSGVGKLQNAMNGKIYIAGTNTVYALDVINNPNAAFPAINFSAQALPTGKMYHEPPQFMASYFRAPLPAFTFSATCGLVNFVPGPPLCSAQSRSVTAMKWIFGDPSSGSANTSSFASATHVYNAPGSYSVALVLDYGCGKDTIRQVVNVSGVPALAVTGPGTVCIGKISSFTASGASTYSWNGVGGASTATFAPSSTASYTLSGTGSNGCSGSKVFTVVVSECLGMREERGSLAITIYPNPAAGVFNVQSAQMADYRILDVTGRLALGGVLQPGLQPVDLRSLPDGLYLIQVAGSSGTSTHYLQKRAD